MIVYTLQEYPKLIENVIINPGVSNFIFKGANLMWPGVQNPEKLTPFKADDVRIIIDDAGKYFFRKMNSLFLLLKLKDFFLYFFCKNFFNQNDRYWSHGLQL